MKVYVVHFNRRNDYRQAEQYGKLVRLLSGSINVFDPFKYEGILRARLADFEPTLDLLLLSGPVAVNVLALLILAEKHEVVDTLQYGANQSDYKIVTWEIGRFLKKDKEGEKRNEVSNEGAFQNRF